MTTALDMIPAIGARVSVRFESLQIEATIKNVKNAWGQPRLLIAPVSGTGEQWVELGRVTVPAPEDEPDPATLKIVQSFLRDRRYKANQPDREGLNRPALPFRQNRGC
jgi:hypothetical protein